MHAIVEPVSDAWVKPVLRTPEAYDIFVDLVGSWQLDEIDRSLASISERLNP